MAAPPPAAVTSRRTDGWAGAETGQTRRQRPIPIQPCHRLWDGFVFAILPRFPVKLFAVLHRDFGPGKAAGIVVPRDAIRLALFHGNPFPELAIVMPALECSGYFAVNNSGLGHFPAIFVPFLAQAVGDAIVEALTNLHLPVGVPS